MALWHHACFLVEMRGFIRRYGGLWLLSDGQAESDLADVVYRIGWHTPLNEEDDSYLRLLHEQSGGELALFWAELEELDGGQNIHAKWQKWARGCQCEWEVSDEVDIEHFPTHRHQTGIQPDCQLHATVAACNDYTTLVDDDWQRIADWYRLPGEAPVPANDRKLYDHYPHQQRTLSP